MNAQESQMYNLGRQAREADYKTESCNLAHSNGFRAWWLAGWHDLDFEKGNRMYKSGERI